MTTEYMEHVYYECEICDDLHPWEWSGDCRDDANRFTHEDLESIYGDDYWHLDIRTMSERVEADDDD